MTTGRVPPFQVDLAGAQGAQVGDHNTQYNKYYLQVTAQPLEWPVRSGRAPASAASVRSRPGLHQRIEAALPSRGVVVLRGDGGRGKTQAAVAVAAGPGASGVDLVVWVSAGSVSDVQLGYAQASAAVRAGAGEQVEADAARFLEWLAGTGRSWLVVLDDLNAGVDLSGWWPPAHREGPARGGVVVTTRRRDAAVAARGVIVEVDVFDSDEAVGYLADRLAGCRTDVLTGAEDLAADLGRLPLALSGAAAVIADQGWTCAEFRSRLADRGARLLQLFPGQPGGGDDYATPVAATWSLAVAAADAREPIGVAGRLALLVALLDPQGVPELVLTSAPVVRFAGRGDVLTADQAYTGLRNLHLLSVIDHDPAGGGRSIRMHALAQRAVREVTDENLVSDAVSAAADALEAAWPDVETDLQLSQALGGSTAALRSHGTALLLRDGVHPVLFRAGNSLLGAGQVRAAVMHFDDLSTAAERVLGPDHPDNLASRNNLALAYASAGDLGRAIPLHEQTLADRERVLGPDHRDTLSSRNYLAYAYWLAGERDRAVTLFEQALADRERVLGPDHPDTLGSRNNLGLAYESVGDFDRAIPMCERALADRERVLGPDHPDTLGSRNNLALTCKSAGDLDRAILLNEQNLADRLRVLGPDHPDTSDSRSNLAMDYWSSGDLDRAIPMLEQTLSDRQRVLSPDHPDTLGSRDTLAEAYESAGDPKRAIPLAKQILSDRQRVIGPDHPDILDSKNNLALAYWSIDDFDQAIPLFQQTLSDRQRVLGPDHPDTLISGNNLAYAYWSAGDLDRAIPLNEQTLSDMRRVLGPDHRATLRSRYNLALAYQLGGDLGRAIPLFEQSLSDRQRVLGPDDQDTLTSRYNLALAYQSGGDLDRAIPIFEQALSDMQRILGPDHQDSQACRGELAIALQESGSLSRALDVLSSELPEVGTAPPLSSYWGVVTLSALSQVKAGAPPPELPPTTPMHRLVGQLLAAAGGDEASRLALPPEWLRLLATESSPNVKPDDSAVALPQQFGAHPEQVPPARL